MVRIHGIGSLIVLLISAGLSVGEPTLEPLPAGQPDVVPAENAPVIRPVPVRAGPQMGLTPESAHKLQRTITVEEPGHPPAKCRILKAWHTPDGGMAREVQVIETGEIMTIADSGPVLTAQSSESTPRLHEVASRIFHWGRSSTPPPGAPVAPEAETPDVAQASPPPWPVPPGTASVAPPSDWRQSWGNASNSPAPGSSNSYAPPPGQTPLPRSDYSANVPSRSSAASLEYPTKPAQSAPTYQAQVIPQTGSLFAPSPRPVDTDSTGRKVVIATVYPQPRPADENSPAVRAATAAAAAAGAAQPATPPQTAVAPTRPAVSTSVAAIAPKTTDLPKADSQRPDPLATPDRYSRRSTDLIASTPKGAPSTQQTSAATDKTAFVQPQQPLSAVDGKALPAGAQSVLAAQGGNPGSICYLPVPIVTLPSEYRPQPNAPRIPQAPQPIRPGPDVDPNMISANAFTPAGSPAPGPQQQVAMVGDIRNAFTKPPSGTPPQANPAAMNAAAYAQAANRMAYPRPPMPGMYAQGGNGQWYPGVPAAGMPPQNMPMAGGMMPPAARGPAWPYPPAAMAPAQPGVNAPAATAVTPVAYYSATSAGQLPPLSTEARLTAADAHNSQALFQLLKDSLYPSQREWAADNLSAPEWRANPQVVQALVAAAHDDPAPTVRVACVHSLAKLNAKSAPVLATLQGLKADTDPRVRNEVDQALATLAQQQARAAERAAQDPRPGTASVAN